MRAQTSKGPGGTGGEWLYGVHAVEAALANPRRKLNRLLVLAATKARWAEAAARRGIPVEPTDEAGFRRVLGDAVHQGVALAAASLEPASLEDLLNVAPDSGRIALVLDQITDPHNVGAILRSAAAFAASAVILQERHAPALTGVVAKAASGALDIVPIVRVVNIARTIEELKDAGFTTIGLAEEATATLAALAPRGDVAIVLGAEGEGLRRLVRETCHWLARLPTNPKLPSLNVSNAAAVALYELRRGAQ